MSKLVRNVFKNGIASLFQKTIRILEQLFLVPFFISAWGEAYYGEWLTLTIIPNVLALANLGFGTAAGNNFVLEYVGDGYQKAADINKNAIFIITIIVLVTFVLSCLTLFILDVYNIFDNLLIIREDALTSVAILMLSRLITFYTQYFDAYYRAVRKASLGINLINIRSLASIMFGLIVLLLGYGVIIFAISQLLINLFFNLYFGYKGRKLLIGICDLKGTKNVAIIKEIAKKGFGFLITPLWQAVYFQGTTIVIRIVLGAESVTIFNTVRRLTRSVNQLYSMVNVSIFPELQVEIGQGNFSKARKLFNVSFFFTFFVAALGSVLLSIFGLWFYKIWTNNQIEVSPILWYTFVVGILFNAIWWTSGVVFRAFNQPKIFAVLGLISAFLSVLSTYILANIKGLNGAAFGALVLEIFMAISILPFVCKLLNMKVRDLFVIGFVDFIKVIKKIKFKRL